MRYRMRKETYEFGGERDLIDWVKDVYATFSKYDQMYDATKKRTAPPHKFLIATHIKLCRISVAQFGKIFSLVAKGSSCAAETFGRLCFGVEP